VALAAALCAAGVASLQASATASGGVTVTSVVPHQLAQGATRTFTITGSGFQSGAVIDVSGGGFSVSNTTVTSASKLTTSLTASNGATLGARSLTVTVINNSGTLDQALVVSAPPSLTSVTPDRVARSGRALRLTLSGSGFEKGMGVRISGGRLLGTSVASASTARFTASFATNAALGTHTVTLTNPDGGVVTDATALTVDAVPSITSITPTMATQDETTTETIKGRGFEAGATVSAGSGVRASVVSTTPTTIVVTLRTHPTTSVGRRAITVTNPDQGTVTRPRALRVDYAPIFTNWAVGDGAIEWSTTLRRPTFTSLPTLSFSGAGVTVASKTLNGAGQLVVQLTVDGGAAATWRTMSLHDATSSWSVPRAIKVRLPPTITNFPSLKQGTSYKTVKVTGANFEVCSQKDPIVTISGTGVTVNMASTALGNLMYVNVSVDTGAALGPRDVTMTNCDSGGTATSAGVFTVTA